MNTVSLRLPESLHKSSCFWKRGEHRQEDNAGRPAKTALSVD
jgi:hypothetical protein